MACNIMYRYSNCQHPPINIVPPTVSLSESYSSRSPVFHEQERRCGAFAGKDCAAMTGTICSNCSIANQSPHSIQPSPFSESRLKNRIMPEELIFDRRSSCNSIISAKVSCSRPSFSVTTRSSSSHEAHTYLADESATDSPNAAPWP